MGVLHPTEYACMAISRSCACQFKQHQNLTYASTLISGHHLHQPAAPTRELVATKSFLPLRRSISSKGTRPGSSWMYLTGSTGGNTRRWDEAQLLSQQCQSAGP